jgi:acyl-CoA thioesterase YciA
MPETDARPDTPARLITVAPFDQATPRGAVTGGWILTQLDHAAGLAGRKVSGGEALILSIRELTFHAPLRPGEEFALHADLTRRGNTSFNLAISAWAEPEGDCRKILTADVVLVAIDAAGHPRKLPS